MFFSLFLKLALLVLESVLAWSVTVCCVYISIFSRVSFFYVFSNVHVAFTRFSGWSVTVRCVYISIFSRIFFFYVFSNVHVAFTGFSGSKGRVTILFVRPRATWTFTVTLTRTTARPSTSKPFLWTNTTMKRWSVRCEIGHVYEQSVHVLCICNFFPVVSGPSAA